MKENFYSDIQNKFDEKIKTKYFRNDSAIKNEIITMKKIGAFWSKFFQYCSPIIRLQKIHLMKRNIPIKYNNINRSKSMININKIKNWWKMSNKFNVIVELCFILIIKSNKV